MGGVNSRRIRFHHDDRRSNQTAVGPVRIGAAEVGDGSGIGVMIVSSVGLKYQVPAARMATAAAESHPA